MVVLDAGSGYSFRDAQVPSFRDVRVNICMEAYETLFRESTNGAKATSGLRDVQQNVHFKSSRPKFLKQWSRKPAIPYSRKEMSNAVSL